MFARRDKDGDGKLTREEFLANQPDPEQAPKRFETFLSSIMSGRYWDMASVTLISPAMIFRLASSAAWIASGGSRSLLY